MMYRLHSISFAIPCQIPANLLPNISIQPTYVDLSGAAIDIDLHNSRQIYGMHQKDLQPCFPPQTITSRRGITAYKHLSSSITHPSTHASTSYGRSSVTPKFRFCVCKTASERSHEDEGFRFLINGLQFKIAAVLNVLSKNIPHNGLFSLSFSHLSVVILI